MTADGKIDTVERLGATISSALDWERVDRLRAESDAVMVGGHTLLGDDPRLTVKSSLLRAARKARGLDENPIKVGIISKIEDPRAGPTLHDESRFVTSGPARRVIFTTKQTDPTQVARLRELVAIVPSSAKAHLLLGEALDNTSESELAISELRRTIEIDPRLPEAHYALGYALLRKGETDEAAQRLTEELELNPRMTLALYHLGKINFNRGNLDAAISMFSRVVETEPDFRPGLEALGQALLKKRNPARAVEVLEHAVNLDPSWPDGHVLLGRAYMAIGRRDDAKKEFDTAQKLSREGRKRIEEKVGRPKSPERP